MNAIPVINPATVTEVFHAKGTELLSIKKNAVAASIPIAITQNVIPTKSSEANKTASAFAALDKLTKITKAKANVFSLLIKKFFLIISYYSSILKHDYNSNIIKAG